MLKWLKAPNKENIHQQVEIPSYVKKMSCGGTDSYPFTMMFHLCCMKSGVCQMKSAQVTLVCRDVEISG